MERSKRDLETLVSSQKEQLSRYEKRLKDVVTAYKGLLKEKEALETSLAALTTPGSEAPVSQQPSSQVVDSGAAASPAEPTVVADSSIVDERNQLQTQIITLMNSLATLSAEKSRMEASFQADKKQLRAQLVQRNQTIAELQASVKDQMERAKANVEEMKAKWIVERQEREKETNNQMLMIRELQKLYADERHLKENIEMQLNNFKTQFASNETESARLRELQAQLKEARAQLKKLQASNKEGADGVEEIADSAAVLRQVQQEMQQLKEQHAVAIKNEQKRVLRAEEQSKRQAALHEDRVANLESRLAELSSTVGTYDRLRQQDQENIQLLRKKLQDLDAVRTESNSNKGVAESQQQRQCRESADPRDVAAIVDEIMHLKQLLMRENTRAIHPIDVSKVFSVGTDHMACQEDLARVQQECEKSRSEVMQLQKKLLVQKTHIETLQEKVKVLNRNIDEQELELKQHGEKMRQATKEERSKWKEALAEMENECRCKVVDLEQQLQKQRQRSLQLLDEKEQEIKTLQTSFEIFHYATTPTTSNLADGIMEANATTSASDAESNDGNASCGSAQARLAVRAKKLSVGENCHMLHYANEIARKDIEIAGLRKAKYAAQSALRKAVQEKVTVQEELCDRIDGLEEQVDRLERCKTREGANLEYLKNVIISFIVTRDADGKRHMLNAISAVLQFTPTETQIINAAFHKK